MSFKKVDKFFPLVEFNKPGDSVEGMLLKISQGTTQYGEAEFLNIERIASDGETEIVSVAIGASLQGYEWVDYLGYMIRLEFTGEEKSKNHKGKKYKTFDLYVDFGD